VARLIVNPHVLRCFLRPSFTEVPSLPRSYPASQVRRTSPPPHTARPISPELPVDPYSLRSPLGFPVLPLVSSACMPSPLPRQVGWTSFARTISISVGLPQLHGGSAPALIVSRPAQRSLNVMACTLAESPSDPLHRKLRPFRYLRSRFGCYRVERTSSRAGVAPAEVQRLFTAHA
jgi:hypothetical protein